MEPSKTTATPLTRAMETIKQLRAQLDAAGDRRPLAVVGAGLRLPGGITDLDGYWRALRDGRDLVRARPQQRLAPFAAEWAELPNQGSFLDEVLDFDADFFGISPREARAVDPQHRLLLEVAWEALEDAALPPARLGDAKVGVWVGITGGQDYRDWQTGDLDAYWATGNGHSFAAGRISYCLGLTGPAVAVDTACSSSLVALHQAGQALRRGEVDVALAGGVNLVLSPGSTRIIEQTRSLSPDGRCKAFDARANGFVRGEGCGIVVLKRLDRALADGDRIHGVVAGSALNQDGRSSGFTAPNVLAQTALLEAALADAGLTAADIGLVEAHGTGTSLGDPIEMDAILDALGRKNGGRPLHVGSVKANLGHLEGASGVAGVLKALLCVKHGEVPPLVHFRTLNPRIDLDGTAVTLSREVADWGSGGQYAGVSSFGMIGTNAHVIVGPAEAAAAVVAAEVRGFDLSARTESALRELAGELAAVAVGLGEDEYPAFAYTAGEGRTRHEVAVRIVAATAAEAADALRAVAEGREHAAVGAADGEGFGPLPRRVIDLPHYPWQRARHAPEGCDAATASGGAAGGSGGTGAGLASGGGSASGRGAGGSVSAGADAASGRSGAGIGLASGGGSASGWGAGGSVGAGAGIGLASGGGSASGWGAGGSVGAGAGIGLASGGGSASGWGAGGSVGAGAGTGLASGGGAAARSGVGAGTAFDGASASERGAAGSVPLYEVGWERVAEPGAAGAAGTVVLAGDDVQVLALLATQWQALGHRGVLLGAELPSLAGLPGLPGWESAGLPVGDAAWGDFWAARPEQGPFTLLLAPRATPLPERPEGADPAADGARLLAEVTVAVRALAASGRDGRAFALTRAVRRVSDTDPVVAADHGLLHGLLPVLGLEYPSHWGGVIDLPAGPAEADARTALALAAAGTAPGGARVEDLLAVRAGAAFGARLRAVDGWRPELPVDPDAGYLITGGAGGVGRAVAEDLVRRGARHLLLVGRTPLERLPQATADWLASLAAGGVTALYRSADCDRYEELAAALSASGLPALRGVVHAAGTLPLGPLAEADAEAFAQGLRGKFSGAWWLHLLTEGLDLDFFLTTSSASALWGADGRGAYAAANGGLDALAAYRVAAGRPASAVAFGAWALDGMADEDGRRTLARMGLADLDGTTGCSVLTAATPGGSGQVLACPVEWPRFLEVMEASRARALFAEVAAEDAAGAQLPALREELLALPEQARAAAAAVHVGRTLAAVLGHAEGHTVPPGTGFYNLGLDSIMAVDLARDLSLAFAVDLKVADVFNYPTVEQLSALVAARVADAPAAAPARTAGAGARAGRPVTTAAEADAGATAVPQGYGSEPVAIVGMAGRFPGADSVEELWQLLAEGRDAVGPVPADRWDGAALHSADPLSTGTVSTDQGGFLSDLARFDAAFFGVPAREAESLDPQHRLLLEAAWHALEDAGSDPRAVRGSRTGVFVGISNSDYARLLERGGLRDLDAYFGTGTALNAAAGRLAYTLGANGPALAVDTACSSSLVALHLAVRSLRSGESDRALAGGVNVIASPECSVAVSRAHMLSPDGRCKTFSAEANGFVRAEGVGVLVLKRLSDARRDGDRVLAVVHGTAVNQDGASSGLTVPSGRAQEAVIRDALADAELPGSAISYLEAHGTGTSLGDPIELAAAWAALGPDRRPGEPLHVGSVKSNIGHCESASGIAGVIKTVLALRHRRLPASLHAENLNPHVPWDEMNVRVVDALTPWRTGDRPRLAGVSSFGFSGTNAQVILGEAPETAERPAAEGPYLLPLSAPDGAGLARLAERWTERLAEAGDEELPGLAATAGAGRAHFPVRRALLGSTAAELRAQLADLTVPGAQDAPRIAFLFSGMGSQYFGMGRELYESEPVFRDAIDTADRTLAPLLGTSLLDLMFHGSDESLIDQTRFVQPTVIALELALVALWESWGVRAAAVTGHSVGEIAAAIHAGVLDLEAGLTLVAHRARLMHSTETGAMLSLAAPLERVTGWLAGSDCDLAAVNGPKSVVVAGRPEAVERIAAQARAEGVVARRLTVSTAAHSRLMGPVIAEFSGIAEGLAYGRPRIPVISNLTGRLATPADLDAAYWARHIRQPVLFHQGMAELAELGVDLVLEVGPGRTLANLISAAGLLPARGGAASLVRGAGDRSRMLAAAAHLYRNGQDLDWAKVQAGAERTGAPRYPFADTRYWTAVEPAAPAARPAARRHWGDELRSPALPGRVFSFERSAEFPPYLTDHRIDGIVLTPASSHLATLLSAVAGDGSPLAVEDFICPRGLVIKDGEQYEVQLGLGTGTDPAQLTVHSLVDPERGAWTHHLSARTADPSAGAPRPAVDRQAFVERAERHIGGEEFYAYFRELGYTLGPSFRWIADIWLDGEEALVRYTTPPVAGDDLGNYQLHPGLIDSVFQSIAGFMVDGTAVKAPSVAIPFAAARLAFPGRPVAGEELWGHVRVLQAAPLDRGRLQVETADLHLFTARGEDLMVADGFRVRNAPLTTLRQSLRRGVPHAYELGWIPQPGGPAAAPTGARALRVLGAAALTAELRAAGHETDAELPELVVDARFAELPDEVDAAAAERAAQELAEALRTAPADVPYAVPVDGRPAAAPLRAALWGLLAALETEQPERTLLRITLGAGHRPGQLATALAAIAADGPADTRITLDAEGTTVARLLTTGDLPAEDGFTGGALVTGGLGALGLSVAEHLAGQGAAAITLVGRSAPDGAAQAVIDRLTAGGVRVQAVAADVTDPADCARAVAEAERLAPLTGVFHLAGATADRAFDRLTPEDFHRVFAAKAGGADALAAAVRGRELTTFVLFSSAAATLGSAGQANYGAANGYLDGLAERLRSEGVPATAVAWGPWVPTAKGGMADSAALARAAGKLGVRPLDDTAALPLLALAMTAERPHLLAVDADFGRYAERLAGHPAGGLYAGVAGATATGAAPQPAAEGRPRGWLREELAHLDADDREERVREVVRKLAGDTVGDHSAVRDDLGFEDIGLDSIMAIDLSALVAHAAGADLPATVSIDYPTVAEMARHLTGLIAPAEAAPSRPAAGTPDLPDTDRTTDEDADELSDDELIAAVRRDLAMEL
ncbi:SDR family NAD(P)-dependent oxidoreductase [Kitasatospora terrestris]|uniref:Polyketide synthase n=1 Tax=Kitasatospora terrestris TaxID=258051 RepID=A0ABP9DR16_9ACTN